MASAGGAQPTPLPPPPPPLLLTHPPSLALVCAAPEAEQAASSKPEPSYSGAVDTYAVVDIGGHQLVVEEGRWYTVNRLDVSCALPRGAALAAMLVVVRGACQL